MEWCLSEKFDKNVVLSSTVMCQIFGDWPHFWEYIFILYIEFRETIFVVKFFLSNLAYLSVRLQLMYGIP